MDIDACYRAAYRIAFRLLRCWWRLRRPAKSGAAVALWHGDRLLVVRTSYHDWLDLPGGGISAGETPAAAAARELQEETGIAAAATDLGEAAVYRYVDLDRRLTNHVFTWRVAAPPAPVIDRREIVWAGFLGPAALDRQLRSPLLVAYLGEGEGEAGQPPSGTRQISRA